jgi:hypothetical protein
MAFVTGNEGKLYYATAGSVPTTEITGVTKVKVNQTRKTGKIETRTSDVELNLFGVKTITIDIEMPWNSADTGMVAIRNAFKNNTAIGLKALDAAAGLGADGDFGIETFDHDQPLNEGQMVTIKAVPHAKGTRVATLV